MLYVSLAVVSAPARAAATPYIDGISDQNLPEWDGDFAGSYFASLFKRDWVADGHIRLARYVVQWNVMDGDYAGSRAKFEAWLRDVKQLGLSADVGVTSYDGSYPASAAQYEASLAAILGRARDAIGEPVDYVEAWNEPNNQGHEPAAVAAGLADAAQAVCSSGFDCAVVAGDLEDAPGAAAYEQEYERHLHFVPSIWGLHPYRAVQAMSVAPLREMEAHLPNGGAGVRLWFTEVAARMCTDYGGQLREYGEQAQAERVAWLIDTLMPYARPEHVFYYTFLVSDRRRPSCTAGEPEDEALYVPSADASVPDAPRAAVSYVFASEGTPWAYTTVRTGTVGILAGFLDGLVGTNASIASDF
ncbi:MAG TPA: hypothetical protein VK756_08720 [Solirubrobacteraceae bacterium]|nr:hypothetical protein [Solirubrobacteraceae bacterium]